MAEDRGADDERRFAIYDSNGDRCGGGETIDEALAKAIQDRFDYLESLADEAERKLADDVREAFKQAFLTVAGVAPDKALRVATKFRAALEVGDGAGETSSTRIDALNLNIDIEREIDDKFWAAISKIPNHMSRRSLAGTIEALLDAARESDPRRWVYEPPPARTAEERSDFMLGFRYATDGTRTIYVVKARAGAYKIINDEAAQKAADLTLLAIGAPIPKF